MPIEEVEETAAAIESMEIRGAAAIADAAARALGAQAAGSDATDPATFEAEMREAARILYETRPTAVSLPNALRFVLQDLSGDSLAELRETVRERSREFRADLEHARKRLGRIGANRLRDGDTVMTHCHSTDALATVEHAIADGKAIEAVVKETRPRMQGHITARQLREMGVPVTLIVDSAAHRYLNDVDHVLLGADSIAADGSVVNKIGTSGLAVSARDRGTPIAVAARTIKLHPGTLTGHTVEIEMRDESEVIPASERADIGEIAVENPAFDVTPPRHVDAIITERGQFPPESIVSLMRERYGEILEEPWAEPT
ncbi:MAG: ribose 1,5-bisphosphate isomerase [Halodesulfurarchaeum sp.]